MGIDIDNSIDIDIFGGQFWRMLVDMLRPVKQSTDFVGKAKPLQLVQSVKSWEPSLEASSGLGPAGAQEGGPSTPSR